MNANSAKLIWGVILVVVLGIGYFSLAHSAISSPQDIGIMPTPTSGAPTPEPVPPLTERALAYLVEKYSLSKEQIIVASQYQQDYFYLEKSYWIVDVLDLKSDASYQVLVDLSDESVSEDILIIERAEQEAKRARFGKLEPDLFERLESMKEDEEVQVVIWVAGELERSEQDRYSALATMYPEAQEALERSGNPFDVGDYDLSMEISREHLRMIAEDTKKLLAPAVERLNALGYEATTAEGMPYVFATLSKAAILGIEPETWVGSIYLADQSEEPEIDTAVPSDHVSLVWSNGFDGGPGGA